MGIFGQSIELANKGKIDLAVDTIPDLKDTTTIPWHLAKLGYSTRVGTKQGWKYVEIWVS